MSYVFHRFLFCMSLDMWPLFPCLVLPMMVFSSYLLEIFRRPWEKRFAMLRTRRRRPQLNIDDLDRLLDGGVSSRDHGLLTSPGGM